MKTVFIAGASGYLGRHLCEEYRRRDWYVTALVRSPMRGRGPDADQLVEAEATDPASLRGAMSGTDLVISCLGITRQVDYPGYRDIDYRANLNLLREAERAEVGRFAYVHVLRAAELAQIPMVRAESDFVEELLRSTLDATIIAPTGFFPDMAEILRQAQRGRVWLFGDGPSRINPIHGADLATAIAEAIEAEREWLDIGGPAHFFLSASAFDMAGPPSGTRHLREYLTDSLGIDPIARLHTLQIERKFK